MKHPSRLIRHATSIVLLAVLALACSPTSLLAVPTPTPTSPPIFQGPAGIATVTPTAIVTPIAIPRPLPTATPLPTPTPSTLWLTGEIRVYPGPLHYAGDVLSIEVAIENAGLLNENTAATLTIDNHVPLPITPFVANSPLRQDILGFRWAWDTTDQAGLHKLTVSVPIGQDTMQELSTHVEILPSGERPAQEQNAAWAEQIIPCCKIAYVTHTASARDIHLLAVKITSSIAAVEEKLGFLVSGKPIPITLIDNIWGHGAFAGTEIVISYVDRDYAGVDVDNIIRHEGTHYAMRPLQHKTPTILVEGVAVYVAGGHYKPEPIPERAAALLQLNQYIPLAELATDFYSHQHEIAYLEAAGLVSYLVETYDWYDFLALYSTTDLEVSEAQWLDQALRLTYNKGLSEIEADYMLWLRQQNPGDQTEDLRLTIKLLDTVRRYQTIYAPYQEALPTAGEALEQGLVAELVREPNAPENIALEAILSQAGWHLQQGNYTSCEASLLVINQVLDDRNFAATTISDYLAITHIVAAQGYEAQHIDILGNQATVRAIRTWPKLDVLTFLYDGTTWLQKNR
ncbi:MAG: hypothetical protein JXB07_17150 [Anaerolineae bacterium]|nr:hypothetical protein [Anaerolineae bacterium]